MVYMVIDFYKLEIIYWGQEWGFFFLIFEENGLLDNLFNVNLEFL